MPHTQPDTREIGSIDGFYDGYSLDQEKNSSASSHVSEAAQSDGNDDPASHSCTPGELWQGLSDFRDCLTCCTTPQQQQTWSNALGDHFQPVMPVEAQLSGLLVADRFQMHSIIGCGSFGYTYKAMDVLQNNAEVAVKIAGGCPSCCKEPPEDGPNLSTHGYTYDCFLQAEWQAYHTFMAEVASAAKGFPNMLAAGIHTFCPETDNLYFKVSYLAMELVGPTVWEACNSMQQALDNVDIAGADPSDTHAAIHTWHGEVDKVPSRQWIVETGKGMLKALASVHSHGYIHRDVKTENFCLGTSGTNDAVFLIDFGFSRSAYGYYSFRTAYQERCASFWGTPNYASLSSLMSFPQTPRDDLEALVYCMLEMESPNLRLPWNNTLTTNAEAKKGWGMSQLERMSRKKHEVWLSHCKQGHVPQYLVGYFDYITSLGPQDIPDYEWLLLQLESGRTGRTPERSPFSRTLQDWPTPWDIQPSRDEYASYATFCASAAASKILPTCDNVKGMASVSAQHVKSKTTKRLMDNMANSDSPQKRLKLLPLAESHDDGLPAASSTTTGGGTGTTSTSDGSTISNAVDDASHLMDPPAETAAVVYLEGQQVELELLPAEKRAAARNSDGIPYVDHTSKCTARSWQEVVHGIVRWPETEE